MKKFTLITLLIISCFSLYTNAANDISSPDKKITAKLLVSPEGKISYSVTYSGTPVITTSQLGLIRNDADFSTKLKLSSASAIEPVKDNYTMLHGKRHNYTYTGNRKTFHFLNATGNKMDLVFQVSNDGVAFRYIFP